MNERFFAPCPRGLETALAAELTALGGAFVTPAEGGVAFAGPIALADLGGSVGPVERRRPSAQARRARRGRHS